MFFLVHFTTTRQSILLPLPHLYICPGMLQTLSKWIFLGKPNKIHAYALHLYGPITDWNLHNCKPKQTFHLVNEISQVVCCSDGRLIDRVFGHFCGFLSWDKFPWAISSVWPYHPGVPIPESKSLKVIITFSGKLPLPTPTYFFCFRDEKLRAKKGGLSEVTVLSECSIYDNPAQSILECSAISRSPNCPVSRMTWN